MTPGELSSEIANHFEPKPDDESYGGTHRSALGWWYHHGVWQPRPITDPEICLRLLKWLIRRGIEPVGSKWDGKEWTAVQMDGTRDTTHYESLELAIAEAVVAEIRRRE